MVLIIITHVLEISSTLQGGIPIRTSFVNITGNETFIATEILSPNFKAKCNVTVTSEYPINYYESYSVVCQYGLKPNSPTYFSELNITNITRIFIIDSMLNTCIFFTNTNTKGYASNIVTYSITYELIENPSDDNNSHMWIMWIMCSCLIVMAILFVICIYCRKHYCSTECYFRKKNMLISSEDSDLESHASASGVKYFTFEDGNENTNT